ncbi:MAG: L,D-transpeptidase [Gordonia sp. (in: high G+C Gram-positive bacteria)]|uniref:L,D-transpeptidase n=1 Tax=Gordonia sp. (in: high G+C Gram-positive bacteria) TaxID=84139 RepID=UPI0039E39ACF
MFSAKSSSRRKSLTVKAVAVAAGAASLAVAAPAVADASPAAKVTVFPGGPTLDVPAVPELPNIEIPGVPKPTTPKKSKPKATKEAPAVPAAPNVSTRTGYIGLALDSTHTLYWYKDGQFIKSMPTSMGSNEHPTPNGVFHTMEKYRDMYMDSSTYGVPVDSPEGYRTYVEYATRLTNDGIFIHAAPWSVAQQGVTNVSHGCLNVSTENGKWVYDNIGRGTPVVIRGTVGGHASS